MLSLENELKKIADLAHLDLDTDPNMANQLAHDVNAIMDYVDQLRQIDTQGIAPLLHPLDLYQRLREDHVDSDNCVSELAEIAPLFQDDLYLVPKVIDTGE